jgi:AAA+ ATPase superfamily predicted ATPase
MDSFLGRAGEMARLTAELEIVRRVDGGRFVWLRGRRRVGKSRLVQEFCDSSGARYCFYQAPARPRDDALNEFVEAVQESTLETAAAFEGTRYAGWSSALRAAVQGATAETPVILVIDELPYLVEHDLGFAADLQKAWDRTLERAPVLVICVGSDVRMMDELVRERAPLHGRPTLEVHVKPLDPRAVGEITGAESPEDAFDRYLVVGGFPLLAASWRPGDSRTDFLRTALIDDQTPFVTTALRILASEFQRELQAERVIEAIGHGESGHGRISNRSGVKGNTLSDALDVLTMRKGLVSRSVPYAAPPGKQPARYTVVDAYLRFWLRFVGPHIAELSRGRGDLVISRIERDWTAYRGRAVEPIVRTALERLLTDPEHANRLGGAQHVGSWWKRDHSIEVDLVGGDAPVPEHIGFVGSIKWHERRGFGADEARALAVARTVVPGAETAKLVAVSRGEIERGVAVDEVFGPAELLAAWCRS